MVRSLKSGTKIGSDYMKGETLAAKSTTMHKRAEYLMD